jgi:hypothetical protein
MDMSLVLQLVVWKDKHWESQLEVVLDVMMGLYLESKLE